MVKMLFLVNIIFTMVYGCNIVDQIMIAKSSAKLQNQPLKQIEMQNRL